MLRAATTSKLQVRTWLGLILYFYNWSPFKWLLKLPFKKDSQLPKAPSYKSGLACTYRTVKGLYISISIVHQFHSVLYFQCMLSVCIGCTGRTLSRPWAKSWGLYWLHLHIWFNRLPQTFFHSLLNTDTEASADHHSWHVVQMTKVHRVSLNLFNADFLHDNKKLTMMSTQAQARSPNSQNLHSSILPLHCTAYGLG